MTKYSMTETRRTRRMNQSTYGATSNRSTFGYWVPLVLTVTAATVGLAAWIWSERKEEDEEYSSDEQYNSGGKPGPPPPGFASMSGGLPPGPGPGGYQDNPGQSVGGAGPMGGPPAQGGFYGGPPPPPGNFQNTRDIDAQSTGVQQTRTEMQSESQFQSQSQTEETGLVARVSSALGMGRAPSPGQAYDWASRNISAGVAAAAASVGGALGYEASKEQYEDHERWNEEAEQRDSVAKQGGIQRRGTASEFYSGSVSLPRSASIGGQKRKTVAIVLSSVENPNTDEDVGAHASILTHLPSHINKETTKIFVLIYAPTMTNHPHSPSATNNPSRSNSRTGSPPRRPSQSMASSFSEIRTDEANHTPAATPGDFPGSISTAEGADNGILANVDPQPIDESTTPLYKTLHNQAMQFVDRDTMIIPFTSPQGHKHILKSIQPEIAYIQESLCGTEGEIVAELSGWVRTVVVVIGDEGGLGGLVDTDTEDEVSKRGSSGSFSGSRGAGEKWWKKEERTGVGRGVTIVESLRVGEDWRRRVSGED